MGQIRKVLAMMICMGLLLLFVHEQPLAEGLEQGSWSREADAAQKLKETDPMDAVYAGQAEIFAKTDAWGEKRMKVSAYKNTCLLLSVVLWAGFSLWVAVRRAFFWYLKRKQFFLAHFLYEWFTRQEMDGKKRFYLMMQPMQ